MEDESQLVHQRNVQITLGVLDHLGCFRDLDAGSPMNPSLHDERVGARNDLKRIRILSRNDFDDFL